MKRIVRRTIMTRKMEQKTTRMTLLPTKIEGNEGKRERRKKRRETRKLRIKGLSVEYVVSGTPARLKYSITCRRITTPKAGRKRNNQILYKL